jgi:signal transduction histidine kinase
MKLRLQLALLVAIAIVAALTAAMAFTQELTRAALVQNLQSEGNDAADDIKRSIEIQPPMTDEGIEKQLESALRKHRRVSDIELVLVERSTQYSLKTGSEAPKRAPTMPMGPPSPNPPPPAPPKAQTRTLSATAGDHAAGFEITRKLSDKSRNGAGQLTITVSLESVDRLLDTARNVAIWVGVLAALIAIVITIFAADQLLGRPLARLVTAMGAVSEGALDQRVQVQGPPEVRAVSEAFNRMLDRLQDADKAIRSFNERLASEVQSATAALSERNTALNHLNVLLVRAREDLSHKERLAALGQLAAQLAHEIGTPLGSVSGHLQLALASPDCPPSVRDRLGIASQEIARVSRIIRDYLDSTRRIDPEISDVDVDEIIREAVEVARGGNAARSAGVSVDVSTDASDWRSDEGVVRQVLVNLVANALDAVTPVSAGAVHVRAQLEDGKNRTPELVLRVSDNGPGIASEALGRMFEPFYTTKGRGKGTGLGLAICRELIQSLGGRIEAASEPGKGTTFTVRLPNGDDVTRRAQIAAGGKQGGPVLH